MFTFIKFNLRLRFEMFVIVLFLNIFQTYFTIRIHLIRVFVDNTKKQNKYFQSLLLQFCFSFCFIQILYKVVFIQLQISYFIHTIMLFCVTYNYATFYIKVHIQINEYLDSCNYRKSKYIDE